MCMLVCITQVDFGWPSENYICTRHYVIRSCLDHETVAVLLVKVREESRGRELV